MDEQFACAIFAKFKVLARVYPRLDSSAVELREVTMRQDVYGPH
jgi:hypothetical protein